MLKARDDPGSGSVWSSRSGSLVVGWSHGEAQAAADRPEPTGRDRRRGTALFARDMLVDSEHVIAGEPVARLVSTSYVERQNLTMPMGMRRSPG